MTAPLNDLKEPSGLVGKDRKVLKIIIGNIRAKLSSLKQEGIDEYNALTVGKITDLIRDIEYKVEEAERYLSNEN